MADTDNLKSKTLSAILWNAVDKFAVRITQFVLSIIIARILLPSDYGMIGMLAIFMQISSLFIESGFSSALIQKKDCTKADYCTVFFLNLGVSLFFYAILYVSAPWVADFYELPTLTPIMRIYTTTIVIGALTIVQKAKLVKALNFKSLAQINFISTLLAGLMGVFMAYQGFGVWALVGQSIAMSITSCVLYPFYSKWMPQIIFSINSYKRLFNFGSKLLLSGCLATIINNINSICIGKFYKAQELGFYTRAVQYTDLAAMSLNDIINSVSFPLLSSLQDERERMLKVYKNALFVTAMVVFPAMIMLALLAKPLIYLMLTEKWLPCVPLLQILCFARMITPISSINMNILNAIGRSDLFLKVDLSKMPLTFLVLFITIPLGVKAIVIGSLVSTSICFFINAYLPGKYYGYGAISQLKDWKCIFLSLLIMGACVLPIVLLVSNPWIQLLAGGTVGVGAYLFSCKAFNVFKPEITSLLTTKFPFLKKLNL